MTDFSTAASNFATQVSHLFFPPEISESTPITMKEAIGLLDTQRIARITKIALFTISSVATTVTMVLTQAAIITWPLAIPSIIIAFVTGLIFYRLNSLDEQYIERLNDKTREVLAKNELENLFIKKNALEIENLAQSLKNINRLLQCDIFSEREINKFLDLQLSALDAKSARSLAEFASEQKQPISISSRYEWFQQGRFGLDSFDQAAQVTWDGNPENGISVIYQTKPKTAAANTQILQQ